LNRLKKSGYLIRRHNRTSIYCSPRVRVPLSYWLPGQANVLLPQTSPSALAIAHELQHHRQGDTKWLFAVWTLKRFCFLNPAIYLWSHHIQEIQEFACDEALVDRKKVDLQAYTRCLTEAALTAFSNEGRLVCATGLFFAKERPLLTRRIEKMYQPKQVFHRQSYTVMAALATVLISGAAFASRGLVQDRRVTKAQAEEYARKAQGTFPLVVNEQVLKWLNFYLGTSDGRQRMREALQRLETYRPMLADKLKMYSAPEELLAIPIIESGYQNLAESHRQGVGAGLWMFIPQSARNFGLRVDGVIDERLTPALETEAALRYLQANKLRFSDWQLAIMAYNVGEGGVQAAIDKTGSRDPWALIRAGVENDHDYSPKLMAAVLIMKNPGAVE
jgi:membrane-bound lytic murein transglycosylase D